MKTDCKCKYSVVVNMPGYLSDNEPECYATLAAAQQGAQWHKQQFAEQLDYTPKSHKPIPAYQFFGNLRKQGRIEVYRRGYNYVAHYITITRIDASDAQYMCDCDTCE